MTDAALVLEGGGMRGIFTGGVLDFLMEQKLQFSYLVGVSAGACNAMDMVSGQIGRTRDCIAVDDKDLRYVHMDPIHILKGNAFDMDMLCRQYPYRYFPFDFDAYFASASECELVATSCLTGEAVYFQEKKDRERLLAICTASCSIPLINKEVPVDGIPYVDGGVADSVPVIHAAEKGFRKIVAVLTQMEGYRKEKERFMDSVIRLKYRKYPALVRKLTDRNRNYNRTMDLVDKWEAEGHIFVIRPTGPVVGRTEQDPAVLREFWQQGYDVMKDRYDALLAYLEA